jgi:molybdate transport system ATP-binding protein
MSESQLVVSVTQKLGDFALDVAFQAGPGVTAVAGPSGAGKTSLINMISGISKPSSGQIRVGASALFDHARGINLPAENRDMGYVFQDALLFPHMNVRANLEYGLKSKGLGDTTLLDELVALFNLESLLSRYPAKLSGGEQKRVAIARAIAAKPNILLLDEPLNGIDPARREAFFPYLERLCTISKGPILLITHNIDEIMRLADQIILMQHGRIKAAGPLGEIANSSEFVAFSGRSERGTILEGQIKSEMKDILSLDIGGTELLVSSSVRHMHGGKARLRILARDVALATSKPEDLSVLNVVGAAIVQIEPGTGGEVDIHLDLGTGNDNPPRLISRITEHSLTRLGLCEGMNVWALIKAVAIVR